SVPHSVRVTPERLFSIRSAPIMDSSRRMWALTAGWVRSNRWAALVKLPSSQIATKVRSRSVGILVMPVGVVSMPASDSTTSPLRCRPLRIRPAPRLPGHRGFPSCGRPKSSSYHRPGKLVQELETQNKDKWNPVLTHCDRTDLQNDFTKYLSKRPILRDVCAAQRRMPRSCASG